MTLSVNGTAVIGGIVTMPRRGVWSARLEIDSPIELPESSIATVVSKDAAMTLVGSVSRTSFVDDTATVYLVGGTGGLQNTVKPRGYTTISAAIIAGDILTEVGEALDPLCIPTLSNILTHWARNETTADRALSALCTELGLVWRVQPTGLVWLGTDFYVESKDLQQADVLERDEALGSVVLGCETPWMLPGTSFDGLKVEHVVHEVGDGMVRTNLWVGGEDRVRGVLERLTKKVLPGIDYSTEYEAKVVAQNGDGSLELLPLDPSLPPLSRVPIRYGLPGVSAKVLPGSTCRVSFDGAKPSKPKASLFDSGGLLELVIESTTAVKLTCPNITLGTPAAMPLAHSAETIGAINAIVAALAAVWATVQAINPAIPVMTTDLATYLAPLSTVLPGQVALFTPTLPTLTTKAA